MIVPPTVGPLWDSEIQPELRSCRETSGEHCNLLLTSCVYDCPAYCWRSLGLGHTAGAEILQGDVWDSEIQPELRSCRETSGEHACMIVPPNVGPLWDSEIQAGAGFLEGDVWRGTEKRTTRAEL